jgi:hypothetical protein
MDTTYSVWVGGSEINTHYLNKQDAERIAEAWRSFGYDDVVIQERGE